MGSTRPAARRLGLVLVERAARDVDARRADPQYPFLEIDVGPALTRELAAPQTAERQVPRMPIAVRGDPAQDGAHLAGSERLKLLRLAGHPIDQCSNVSRQPTLGDQLREHLGESAQHVIAGPRTPRLARLAAGAGQTRRRAASQSDRRYAGGSGPELQVAELALHRLQHKLITGRGRRPDLMARTQPIKEACDQGEILLSEFLEPMGILRTGSRRRSTCRRDASTRSSTAKGGISANTALRLSRLGARRHVLHQHAGPLRRRGRPGTARGRVSNYQLHRKTTGRRSIGASLVLTPRR